MDKLDIINMALRKVGAKQVASESDTSQALQLALSSYDFSKDEVLRDYSWSFATVYKILALSNESPEFGYDYAYHLPPDCIQILDLRADGNLEMKQEYFSIVGDKVYANTNQAHVRYISNAMLVSTYPSDFCAALALKIASDISLLTSQNASLPQALMQEYEFILHRAKTNDAKSNNAIELNKFANSTLLQARFRGKNDARYI